MDWLDWWVSGMLGLITIFVLAVLASIQLDKRLAKREYRENVRRERAS